MNFEVILDYQEKISQEIENGFFKDGIEAESKITLSKTDTRYSNKSTRKSLRVSEGRLRKQSSGLTGLSFEDITTDRILDEDERPISDSLDLIA